MHLTIHSEDQQHLQRCLEFLNSRTSMDLVVMLPTNRLRVLVELLTKFRITRITQARSMLRRMTCSSILRRKRLIRKA